MIGTVASVMIAALSLIVSLSSGSTHTIDRVADLEKDVAAINAKLESRKSTLTCAVRLLDALRLQRQGIGDERDMPPCTIQEIN
jgi:hypothetical protein